MRAKAKAAAETLFQRGAILTPAADPSHRFLVGELRWHADTGALLFVAFGEDERDAHFLAIDAITEERDGSIQFSHAGLACAKLEDIAGASVDDPDDYTIAWQLWQQVSPMRKALVNRCFAAIVEKV